MVRELRFGEPVWWVSVSPDSKLLAVQTEAAEQPDTRVELVQIATGKLLQSHIIRHGPAGVEFTHDGRELIAFGCCWTGSGSTLTAWDTRSGRRLFSHGDSFNAAAFDLAPDSGVLGVGSQDGKVLLLDPRSGREIAPPIPAAAGIISQLSFSPDGRRFVVSSSDHTVNVWDVRSRKRLGETFGPFRGTIPAVLFEPDGRLLINLLSDAIEWPVDVRTWERFACRVAGRELSRAEWRDLLPNRPYRSVCPAPAA